MNIIDLTDRPEKSILVRRRTQAVAEIRFDQYYKLCITKRTLQRFHNLLNMLVEKAHKEVAVPLKNGRFLYIAPWDGDYYLSLDCLDGSTLSMVISQSGMSHLHKTARDILLRPTLKHPAPSTPLKDFFLSQKRGMRRKY